MRGFKNYDKSGELLNLHLPFSVNFFLGFMTSCFDIPLLPTLMLLYCRFITLKSRSNLSYSMHLFYTQLEQSGASAVVFHVGIVLLSEEGLEDEYCDSAIDRV